MVEIKCPVLHSVSEDAGLISSNKVAPPPPTQWSNIRGDQVGSQDFYHFPVIMS